MRVLLFGLPRVIQKARRLQRWRDVIRMVTNRPMKLARLDRPLLRSKSHQQARAVTGKVRVLDLGAIAAILSGLTPFQRRLQLGLACQFPSRIRFSGHAAPTFPTETSRRSLPTLIPRPLPAMTSPQPIMQRKRSILGWFFLAVFVAFNLWSAYSVFESWIGAEVGQNTIRIT